ncbi:4,5-DOPA dioxygenase extradiol [Eumeta japonica]|uniref:4,5-DOPA dioxygenase extradiol n=1 Tax=Eumeta variegata TaxID=151549 RepID=A0A4C1YR37_EUMVA|nr:4,5-DOPA dioxygenase extradiol [Eumeta japonica]
MRSRGLKAAFLLLSIPRISGGNFRRSEDAGTSLALLDHCPDVVGKSTYGKSISSVDAMRGGMLLSAKRMTVIGPALFVNHGGGPMPLLGDKDHEGLTKFLRDELKQQINIKELKAIVLVTAHWEESKVTISSGKHHDLYFDYYGFPPETYKYKYDAPGDPELAKRIHEALKDNGIDSKLDSKRGWDHGVFVPMILINPEADVPIVQVSVLSNQDAEQHYEIGKTLGQFRKEGVAIIGSGMSYHNMREFRRSRGHGKVVNKEFDDFLNEACTSEDSERKKALMNWQEQTGALEAHPPHAAEHFMPLIVVAGAGGTGPGEVAGSASIGTFYTPDTLVDVTVCMFLKMHRSIKKRRCIVPRSKTAVTANRGNDMPSHVDSGGKKQQLRTRRLAFSTSSHAIRRHPPPRDRNAFSRPKNPNTPRLYKSFTSKPTIYCLSESYLRVPIAYPNRPAMCTYLALCLPFTLG